MLFASKMFLGMPSRSDTEVVSMGFLGFKPQPGDIVKSVGNNKAQLVTTTGDVAYGGVVVNVDQGDAIAVATAGHVIAHIDNTMIPTPHVGTQVFSQVLLVNQVSARDADGKDVAAFEVKIG